MPQQYFVTYTTQSSVNDVVFHSEVIRLNKIDPVQWVDQKNESEKTKYSLIFFDEYTPFKMCPTSHKSFVSYVSQQGIGDLLFKTEKIIRQNPITWILNKNKTSAKVKYALINYWELKRVKD
jgi:hypothetical protein